MIIFIDGNDLRAAEIRRIAPGLELRVEPLQTGFATSAPEPDHKARDIYPRFSPNGDGVLDSGDTLLGYGTQSSPGVWTYTFTVNLASGTYKLFAQAEDSYGVFGDPVVITIQVS